MSGIAYTGPSNQVEIVPAFSPSWMMMSAKRTFDVCFGSILFLAMLPLSLLVACLIFSLDHGGLFYHHRRVGQGGQPFYCLKFRTMRLDADVPLQELLQVNPEMQAEWQSTGKLKHDPRVTRIGRFLRKTSLDEVPQLINVLLGDMSLVGPRPVVQSELDLHYHGAERAAYFAVRPGITGLWQVSGRSDSGYAQRVKLDTKYVHNLSVVYDILLLLRTIRVVIVGDGAY